MFGFVKLVQPSFLSNLFSANLQCCFSIEKVFFITRCLGVDFNVVKNSKHGQKDRKTMVDQFGTCLRHKSLETPFILGKASENRICHSLGEMHEESVVSFVFL